MSDEVFRMLSSLLWVADIAHGNVEQAVLLEQSGDGSAEGAHAAGDGDRHSPGSSHPNATVMSSISKLLWVSLKLGPTSFAR